MSDTRAAIRELRSLSEKRSQSALTEAEAARWMALRRQLGLPLEPLAATPPLAADASVAPAATPPAPASEERPSTASSIAPEAGPSLAFAGGPLEDTPAAAAFEETDLAPLEPPEEWRGPSLDTPAAPATSVWGGPALDAPAWSDSASERPTDPGLDEPPPAPFDDAPAARPPFEHETLDLGGTPDEPVATAAAAEFISYSRDGDEGIEVPADEGASDALQQHGLAELAGMSPRGLVPEEAVDPPASKALESGPVEAVVPAELEQANDAPLQLGEPETEPSLVRLDVAPQAPFILDEEPIPEAATFLSEPEASADALGPSEGAWLEPDVLPLQASAPTPLALSDVLPEEAPPENEGVVAEPPFTFEQEFAPVAAESQAMDEGAVRLMSSEEGDTDSVEVGHAEAPEAAAPSAPPPPLSTWAPGAGAPPVLASDDFAPSGEALGEGGLDPWPEALPLAASDEDLVETVSEEDFVEDLSTPTPLPAFPAAAPAGSGGIRGFQFPRPPPGPATVPTPPTPAAWERTQPGVPPFAGPRVEASAAVAPAAVAPKTPPPAPKLPAPVLPDPDASPVARASQKTSPTPPTPVRSLELWEPLPAAARAPVTPAPFPPPKPQVASAPSAPLLTAQLPRHEPVESAFPVRAPASPSAFAKPTAAATRVAPVLQPVAEDETGLPLLELVDEVEPLPAARLAPKPLTNTPAAGTADVFGPPMMLNPSFVDGEHRVVVHTLEGQVHRGVVHDLDLHDDGLSVLQPDGRTIRIPSRRVKAVFFVLAPGSQPPPTRGERVQVTFRDGRQVVGYSEDHATGDPGFFVVPADARTNTARVYVFRGGVQSVTTG